mmetsp:Transcript_59083/g.125264  ORF Transcript_59083/g.125264 Transcript_59083/m.125264 type:complete len:81 (-) Transcript_59083:862-1104(-)
MKLHETKQRQHLPRDCHKMLTTKKMGRSRGSSYNGDDVACCYSRSDACLRSEGHPGKPQTSDSALLESDSVSDSVFSFCR